MVFNVCFDPKVIEAAAANGPYAMQALIAMLRGFSANCVLFDFEDTRLQHGIRAALDALPPQPDRPEITALFKRLMKRRFVSVMQDPDWAAPDSDNIQHAFRQAQGCGIQLVVTGEQGGAEVPSADLATYQHTAFELERFTRALHGKVFAAGELGEAEFLNSNFANALRYASRIQICDEVLGNFHDNFEHTIKVLLRWIEPILHEPPTCEITIHCKRVSGTDDHLCHMIRSFRGGRLARTVIRVAFYEHPEGRHPLPHDRFLWTDQFAFEIGRGMDFLDRTTGRNRDVSINLKDAREVTAAIAHCAGMKTEPREL